MEGDDLFEQNYVPNNPGLVLDTTLWHAVPTGNCFNEFMDIYWHKSLLFIQEYPKEPDDPLSNNVSFVTNAGNESTIYEVLEKDPGLTQLEPVTFEVGDTIYWSSQRKMV